MNTKELTERLKDLSKKRFDGWNESTVREEFIAPLLQLLGYARDSDYDVNREEEHLLTKPFLMIGSKKQKLDYALLVRRKTFWLLEAKRADPPAIAEEAVFQAHFYALHPEVSARYFGVCNGRELVLYDTRKLDDKYAPVLRILATELPNRFNELNAIIGASTFVRHLTARVLEDVRSVLSVEIREDRLDLFAEQVHRILDDVRPRVRENALMSWGRKFKQHQDNFADLAASARTPRQIPSVLFEFAQTRHQFNILYSAFINQLETLAMPAQQQEIYAVAQLSYTPLTSIHRSNVLKCLRRLHDINGKVDLSPHIAWSIKAPLSGFEGQPNLRSIWRLESTVHRVLYKASFTERSLQELFATELAQQAHLLSDDEYVWAQPSIAGQRQKWVLSRTQHLWDKLIVAPTAMVTAYCDDLDRVEAVLDREYGSEILRLSGLEEDWHFLGHWGKPRDHMRAYLFGAILSDFDAFCPFIDDEMLQLTEKLLFQIGKSYTLNHAVEFWARMMNERERVTVTTDADGILPADSVRAFVSTAGIQTRNAYDISEGVVISGRTPAGTTLELQAQLDLAQRQLTIHTVAKR